MKLSTQYFILGFALCIPVLITMFFGIRGGFWGWTSFSIAVLGVVCVFIAVFHVEKEDKAQAKANASVKA